MESAPRGLLHRTAPGAQRSHAVRAAYPAHGDLQGLGSFPSALQFAPGMEITSQTRAH
jgi:hypothetical protein